MDAMFQEQQTPTINKINFSQNVGDSVHRRIEACEFLLNYYVTSEKFPDEEITLEMNGIISGLHKVRNVFMKYDIQ